MNQTEISYEDLEQEMLQEIKKYQYGVLATAEGEFVTARVMVFVTQGMTIYCVTPIWSRKYRQIMANSNVAIAAGNLQIEGVALLKGRPLEEENAVNALQEQIPEVCAMFGDSMQSPDTDLRIIEITPGKITSYQRQKGLKILDIVKEKAHSVDFPIENDPAYYE